MSRLAWWSAAAAAGVLGVSPVASSGAQSVAYVGSVQYATGDFVFVRQTWSAYVSNGLTWSAGHVHASASMPVIIQDAGWLQYGGTGMMIPSGGMGMGTDSSGGGMGGGMHGGGGSMSSGGMGAGHMGIGDPVGRLELSLLPQSDPRRALSLVGAVKAPVADASRGFGTGEWDVGAGVSAAFALGGTSVLADAVYWKLGNPEGWALRDAVAYGVSLGRALPGGRWSVLGSVSGASSLWKGYAAPVQLGAGIGYLFPAGSTLTFSAAAGLSRTAPEFATSIGWSVPLGR